MAELDLLGWALRGLVDQLRSEGNRDETGESPWFKLETFQKKPRYFLANSGTARLLNEPIQGLSRSSLPLAAFWERRGEEMPRWSFSPSFSKGALLKITARSSHLLLPTLFFRYCMHTILGDVGKVTPPRVPPLVNGPSMGGGKALFFPLPRFSQGQYIHEAEKGQCLGPRYFQHAALGADREPLAKGNQAANATPQSSAINRSWGWGNPQDNSHFIQERDYGQVCIHYWEAAVFPSKQQRLSYCTSTADLAKAAQLSLNHLAPSQDPFLGMFHRWVGSSPKEPRGGGNR